MPASKGTPVAEARIDIVADFSKLDAALDQLKKRVEAAFHGVFDKQLSQTTKTVNKFGDACTRTGQKVRQTGTDVGQAGNRVERFGQALQKQMFRMHELGIGLLRIGAAFTAMSAGAVAAFGNLESGFLNVQKTTGM
ncbi:MAG: hypothetical protein ABIH23_05990, partial [bacterium]